MRLLEKFSYAVLDLLSFPGWGQKPLQVYPPNGLLQPSDWQQFNQSVGGRLYRSSSTEGPCAQLSSPALGKVPGSTDVWGTCQARARSGGSAAYFVEARCIDDVVATIGFAREAKVPLVVDNYEAEFCSSPIPNSLALLTRMNHLTYHRSFIPVGCGSEVVKAISIESGATLQDIYRFADDNGVTVVAPTFQAPLKTWFSDPTSVLSPSLGSVLDTILEFEAVTPDGRLRRVSSCSEPSLWFALRGGGYQNFGIVTRVTVKAHPKTTLEAYGVSLQSDPLPAVKQDLLHFMSFHALEWAKAGWGGYITPSALYLVRPSNAPNGIVHTPPGWKSLLDRIPGNYAEFHRKMSVTQLIQLLQEQVPSPFSQKHVLSSRMISDSLFMKQAGRDALMKGILTSTAYVDSWLIGLTLPYHFKNENTSVHPAFYDAPWIVYFLEGITDARSSKDRLIKASSIAKVNNFLRYYTPGSGTIYGQADVSEIVHEDAFWGSNYVPLLEIKKQLDPDNVLTSWKSVGWAGRNSHPRFSCYISSKVQEAPCYHGCR